MQQLLGNRYVRLTLLTMGIATLLYLAMWFVFGLIGFDLPSSLLVFVSALASGYIVYRYFDQRIY